jgi:hypothetical protein
MFTETFDCTEVITASHRGWTIAARIEDIPFMGAPWEEHDGHGPVSEWTTRGKMPGERVLASDGVYRRYYGYQAAMTQAKAEGWDAQPYGTGTKGEQAARAVESDFRYLRAWCSDEWRWVGVVVTASKDGIELGSASLFGMGSTDKGYLLEVANELAPEAIEEAQQQIARLCE